jgi:putative spermidine/putrescine transport system permease protein
MRIFFFSLIALFIGSPVVVLVGVSLHETGQMMFPPSNPHLGWYIFFFEQSQWRDAFVRSLTIAALSALVALVVAVPIAYAGWRFPGRTVGLCVTLAMISCLMPAVVMALGFLLFWGQIGYAGEPISIILCHAISFVALPLVTTSLGLRSIDPEWLNAAQTLGANERARFITLVLPYLIPYLISGYLFVFVLSLNEYIIAFMVAGFATETLPVRVFNSLRSGFVPAMAVGAVLFYLIGVLVFALNAKLGHLERLLGVPRDRP